MAIYSNFFRMKILLVIFLTLAYLLQFMLGKLFAVSQANYEAGVCVCVYVCMYAPEY